MLTIEELKSEIAELYSRMSCQNVHRTLVARGHFITQDEVMKCLRDLGVMRRPGFLIGGRPRKFYNERTCKICHLDYVPRAGTQKFCQRCVPIGDRKAMGLASVYNISKHHFDMMLSQQHNACAICHDSFVDMSPQHVHVEHDHKTGAVRGILCRMCNHALGLMKDNPSSLRTAATYIETHEEKQKQLSSS